MNLFESNGNGHGNDNGIEESLPPPPPVIQPDVEPVKLEQELPIKEMPQLVPMARRGLGSKGTKLPLLTNHFKVNVANMEGHFFQYSVSLSYEDGRPVEGKGAGRKVLDRVQETYNSMLNGKELAYDGEKTLFTIGSLT